ncbi:GntR family transcriptional regulator [Microbacterium album]|uniref:GntR family transcriptional regulator n=1 Tax=Microbacterium album TaxID=2053191 RepID=A0A917MKV2_9MICO|nr:GntR family transcriptional regulator [Microbacterium album]GGH34383.1 GntR family transcriptional regulator [Microbacterium album]
MMIGTLDISPTRLSDMVAERIANAIMDGSLPAGTRLRDHDLAQQLGVSRMPVREALQRLQRVGLIETAASRYTRVTEVTPELAAATAEFAAHYTISLLRMALQRMTPEQRAQAGDAIDGIAERTGASGTVAAAVRELQDLLQSYAANAFIETMSYDIGVAIQRNLMSAAGQTTENVTHLHALADAVRTGAADRGERLIREFTGLQP